MVVVAEHQPPKGAERDMLGFETITLAPIDRALIEPGLLSPEEAEWLDAYHARVLATHKGALDADTKTWLAEACAPIGA